MKALLVYPSYPDTFWSFKHALSFVRPKAAFPPLGLLTVAAMLPPEWDKLVVDLNVEPLSDQHLQWADIVLISAMVVQLDSTREVAARARALGRRVLAGGPLFTHLHQEFPEVDHILAGEAEELLPRFLDDLQSGAAGRLYQSSGFPDLAATPAPAWHLIDPANYRSMSAQFSRGCPFDCDFCDVVALFGRRPRLKRPEQVLHELDVLYDWGWRGTIMMVDDNFIGHKARTKELLARLVAWQDSHARPFSFLTQASVNLADDQEMLSLMARANFTEVFLGLETPAESSLQECHKHQNQGRDLVAAVRTIQSHGLEVMGGFIVGFDADPPSIFRDQVRFIMEAAIPTAMVGLLSLMPGTRLWERMSNQNRLLGLPSGDNAMDGRALNFVPKMAMGDLLEGYKFVLSSLYEPRAYYRRVLSFLRRCAQAGPRRLLPRHRLEPSDLAAALRIVWRLGFLDRGRFSFWAFLAQVGFVRPNRIAQAVGFAATGYHLRQVTQRFVQAGVPAPGPQGGTPRLG